MIPRSRLIPAAALLLLASAALADIHVAPDGSGDVATIQDALDLAGPGDEIILADGIFTGPGNHTLVPGAKDVTLRSASGDPAACVISLDGHPGFIQTALFDLTLVGLTLRGGGAGQGGAVHLEGGGIAATDCRFEQNAAQQGGAIWAFNDWSGHRNDFTDCHFSGNRAAEGAALDLESDITFFIRCTFAGNGSPSGSQQVIDAFGGLPTFLNCRFLANENVGAVVKLVAWQSRFESCVFADNQTTVSGPIEVFRTDVYLEGCTFARNTGPGASGVYVTSLGATDEVEIVRCLFARGEGAAPVVDDAAEGAVTIRQSDLFTGGDGWHGSVAAQLGLEGNIDAPPVFCDPDVENFAVADISPCLPANNAAGVLMGRYGQGCALETWHVEPDGASLLADIQTALDLAPPGTEITLADGVFTGPRNRNLDFAGKSLTLRSLSGAEHCILDCQAGALDVRRGFLCQAGEDTTSQVIGLTVRNGRGGAGSDSGGGALLCSGASPAFRQCRFEDCGGSGRGGAVDATAGAAPIFDRCVFVRNTASFGGALVAREGAAPVLRRCTVAANTSVIGSLVAWDASLVLERSIVAFADQGPAVGQVTTGSFSLTDCDLFGNAGGDWTGPVAGLLGQQGNFSEDPCFCDLDAGLLTLCADSWCLPSFNPAGRWLTVGALGEGCADCGCAQPTSVLVDPLRALPGLGRVLLTWSAPGRRAWEFRLEARRAGRGWTVPVVGDAAGFAATDTDARLAAGGRVTYDLFLREGESWRLVAEAHAEVPAADGIELLGAAPNPFNPSTEIVLRLSVAAPAELAIFDPRGRRIATLWLGGLDAGIHRLGWDGRDDAGRAVASGTYLCRLKVDGVTRSLKLTLME